MTSMLTSMQAPFLRSRALPACGSAHAALRQFWRGNDLASCGLRCWPVDIRVLFPDERSNLTNNMLTVM